MVPQHITEVSFIILFKNVHIMYNLFRIVNLHKNTSLQALMLKLKTGSVRAGATAV